MALRSVEMFVDLKIIEEIKNLIQDRQIIDFKQIALPENKAFIRILLESRETEGLLDALEKFSKGDQGCRINIFSVEATLPRIEQDEKTINRIAREELYEDIKGAGQFTWVYLAMVAISTIVASIGLKQNNIAVVIGAMVIAPFLGPNMASALGTTLGDFSLLKRALFTNFVGIVAAVLLATGLGAVMPIDPKQSSILALTHIQSGNITVALAAGCAGSLAFTTGISTMLIGVMVAVSLLPPLVSFGLLLGNGNLPFAIDSLLLFLVNLISVNLSAVAMFLVQGIYPLNLWEKERAKKATLIAIPLWIILLAILIGLIYFLPVS